jgi:hypothetical protein
MKAKVKKDARRPDFGSTPQFKFENGKLHPPINEGNISERRKKPGFPCALTSLISESREFLPLDSFTFV